MLPGLPTHARKLTLTLEYGKPPAVGVEYQPVVDGEGKLPTRVQARSIRAVPGEFGWNCSAAEELEGGDGVKIAVDANASATLRRYGCRVHPSESGPELEGFDAFREPLVKGESLVEHDPRLDEIISLLKRIAEANERKDFLGRERAMPVRIVEDASAGTNAISATALRD